MRSLHIAGTGMLAQQTNVEVISNNIANMTTTGYKRRRAEFQDLLYQNMRRVGSQSSENGSVLPAGAQVGLGVKTSAIYRIGEQGSLQQTENRFDLAMRGNGFFQVQLPSGEIAYTRDGTFGLSARGPDGDRGGLPGAARHHHPRRCARRHHQRGRRGAGEDRRPGGAAECRPDPDRDLRQRGRAGSDGRQHAAGHPGLRPGAARRTGAAGHGQVLQGFIESRTSTWCRRSPT